MSVTSLFNGELARTVPCKFTEHVQPFVALNILFLLTTSPNTSSTLS